MCVFFECSKVKYKLRITNYELRFVEKILNPIFLLFSRFGILEES